MTGDSLVWVNSQKFSELEIGGRETCYIFNYVSNMIFNTLVGSKTSLQRSFQKSRRSLIVNGTKYSRSGKL